MGQIEISGNVSTVEATPKFDMQLGIKQFDISQSFNDLELLKVLAPIAKVIDGKLNSTIDINGLLDTNFTPNLMTITGNATAGVLSSKVNITESPLLSILDTKLDFVDFSKLNLKDVKTKLNFENGQVTIQPFTVKYRDIPIEISGSHSFSKAINYNAMLQVPVKYLGSDVNKLIQSINDPEVNTISIPVTAHIGGTFANPNVTTDLSGGISKLTTQLMEIKKQKLIKSGSDKTTELIGGLLDKNSKNTTKDSTKTDDTIKEGVNSILGGLLGGKKKTKDKKLKILQKFRFLN